MSISYKLGAFRLDTEAQALFRNAEPMALSHRAAILLRLLVERPGELVSKDTLIEGAWDGLAVEESNLTVQIAALRRVLGEEPGGDRWVETMPRRGYRFVGPVAVESDKVRPHFGPDGEPPPLPDKPSIAVLPFQNLSGDTSQNYLVDGLVDDLTFALGREKWLFVVASPSLSALKSGGADVREVATQLGVRFVLRGSFRRHADRVRIVVQLSDALQGALVWSERLEDEIDHVFDMQDRLTSQVAAAIAPALRDLEIKRTQRKRPESLSAFELYLQALPLLRTNLADNRRALELLDQAIALDPTYSTAYAFAARCYQFQKQLGWLPVADPTLKQGGMLARRAAELGGNDPEALWMAGHALVILENELDYGLALVDRSLSLNPSSANAWSSSCAIRTYLGDCETAIEHFYRGQRLNPLDRLHHFHWNFLGLALFGAGRYEEAEKAADNTLKASPTYAVGLRLKLATLGILGRQEECGPYLRQLLAVHPSCSLTWISEFWGPPLRRNPPLFEKFMEGLRLAGIPERPPSSG